MYVRERQAQIIRLITSWFISEHRLSCDWKMSAQSNQKIVSKRITPARRNPFCLSHSLWFRHAQLDCVALVLFCEPYDQVQVRNMSAQPDEIIRFRTTIFWLSHNSSVQRYFGGKDHNVVNLNSFFTLSVRVYVCEHKSDASDTQAESSLASRR